MVKIFEVTKEKTNIKGYWKDEKGKLYIDHIKIFKASNAYQWQEKIDTLLESEICVFVEGERKAFIAYANDYKVFYNKIELHEKTLTRAKIEALLSKYNGFTVYKGAKGFKIVIWE